MTATERFQRKYDEGAPWDVDYPQPEIVRLEADGKIRGRVLDVGCGTGRNAVWLAQRGCQVVAFDFLEHPVEEARRRGRAAGVDVDWRVMDALQLGDLTGQFDTVIDSGLYHVFPPEPRQRYIAGLRHVLASEGRLHIICFSDEQPGTEGPLRISEQDLRQDFASPWEILELVRTRYAILPTEGIPTDAQGARAWRITLGIRKSN